MLANKDRERLYDIPSVCLVQSTGIRTHQCTGDQRPYTCYSAAWNVSYGSSDQYAGEIIDDLHFGTASQATSRLGQYQHG